LASVIDLASRHLIGWSMSDRHDAGLVTGALEAAVATRGPGKLPGTIFHTDRGAEPGFKGSSQRCFVRPIVGGCRGPRRESSIRESFGVAC
jgi:transposase InsO family protein